MFPAGQDHPDIVVLTGAGISKESGLSTFRDADGIWFKYHFKKTNRTYFVWSRFWH